MKTIDWPLEKRKYMKKFERFEPVLQDHTAMNILDTCDHKYFFRIALGRAPKRSNYQVVLDAGNIYHKFREILELSYQGCKNCGHWKHQDKCLHEGCLCTSFDMRLNPDYSYGEAMKYVMKAPLDIPPENTKYTYLDRTALVKCCDYAFENQWLKEKQKNSIQVIAVEQPFNVQLPDGTFTSGRADQIVRWNSAWGRDFKFTSKNEEFFKRSIEPNDQGTRYIYSESELIGERVEGIIFEALHHSFTKSGGLKINIVPHLSQRTQSQLDRWVADKIHINRQLQLNREYDHWPMRTHNCSWCDYANVCRKANELGMMAALETDFELSPWDSGKVNQNDEV